MNEKVKIYTTLYKIEIPYFFFLVHKIYQDSKILYKKCVTYLLKISFKTTF